MNLRIVGKTEKWITVQCQEKNHEGTVKKVQWTPKGQGNKEGFLESVTEKGGKEAQRILPLPKGGKRNATVTQLWNGRSLLERTRLQIRGLGWALKWFHVIGKDLLKPASSFALPPSHLILRQRGVAFKQIHSAGRVSQPWGPRHQRGRAAAESPRKAGISQSGLVRAPQPRRGG